jgi:hypothetical protein
MTSASASRVTRSSRSLRPALLLFAGVLSVATVLRAQESAPAPAAGKSAPPASAPATDATNAARTAAPGVGRPATPSDGSAPAPQGPSPSRFEPSEKVRADFDVSFPIDI